MEYFTIGIDPGIGGAVALIHGSDLVDVWDMPVVSATYGKKNKKEVSPQLLNIVISEIKASCASYSSYHVQANLERVNGFGMGATSAYGFGRTTGVIEGVLAAHDIITEYIMPVTWKKQHGLLKRDKDASRSLAIQKYPTRADLFKLKKHTDRAEAVLLALYKPL